MAFFPMFINLKQKEVLVIGGGKVATRKVKTLLNFGPSITVIARQTTDLIDKLAQEGVIKLHKRSFNLKEDIKNKDAVIVALDDIDLQKSIYEKCSKENIPVNCVDSPAFCTFIFPSVIVRGDFVIGISTSGKAPLISKKVREFLENIIPDKIEDIVESVERVRNSNMGTLERREEMEKLAKKLKWIC